ncbi:MAG: VOC family protein [Acidobacteria bacterium]|nr:VOC family protein [Acidobacteriota bacterium]
MNISTVLDHLVWAVPDLDLAIKEIETATGIKAAIGGNHPSHGTCNALISMGDGEYFEILARDNSLPAGELAKFCQNLSKPNLVTWVVRTNNIPEIIKRAESAGYQTVLKEMNRLKPNGEQLKWQLLWLKGHECGNYVPLIIDWQNSTHPSLDAPSGLKLVSFTVEAINPKPLEDIFSLLSINVNLKSSLKNRMIALIDSPKGILELEGY